MYLLPRVNRAKAPETSEFWLEASGATATPTLRPDS